ncbi:hypothetical protein HYV43_05250 [Candidatus Micrarchaeota archaeon]|nr:hypothetical protein [Candidatus Micrarchaeota archaeon]
MVLAVITNTLLFLTFSVFGQITNILSNPLSDESAWWLVLVGMACVALIV